MKPSEEQEDRLFWALCARALQRSGEGFPSTDDEIEACEKSCEPDTREHEQFRALLKTVLANVRSELEQGKDGSDYLLQRNVLERLAESRAARGLAAAARKTDRQPISPELAKDVERVIEEDTRDEPQNPEVDNDDEEVPSE